MSEANEGTNEEKALGPAAFRTTRWSMVLAAGGDDTTLSGQALEQLCRRYWYPLYAYVRRRGYSHEDASDLTQSYFARLLEKRSFSTVEPGIARFRSYLLGGLKNFLINEWENANRQKRGGGQMIVSLDDENADQRYALDQSDSDSPDKLFERQWAHAVIEAVLARLRKEFAGSEKAGLFDALKPALTADQFDQPYAELAASLGMAEGTLRVTISRMRKRFGKLLRQEVAQTVSAPEEVEAEVRSLILALGA